MAAEDLAEDEDLDFEDAPTDLEDFEDDLDFWREALPDVDDDLLAEVVGAASALAGTVAAVALLDLFSDAWESADDAERDQTPQEDFAEDVDEKLDNMWGDGGSMWGVILDTNAQSEFNDAKGDADQDEGWEYAQYIAESTACDICQPLHGTVLPIDDPWWDEYEPPNHCNCACGKVPLSAAEAGQRGGETHSPPDVDVQPGFGRDKGDLWIPDLSSRPPELVHEYHRK